MLDVIKEFLFSEEVKTALIALGSVIAYKLSEGIFGKLKALAAKTATTVDDEILAKIEEVVKNALEKKVKK